jgi:hypothetical protein
MGLQVGFRAIFHGILNVNLMGFTAMFMGFNGMLIRFNGIQWDLNGILMGFNRI